LRRVPTAGRNTRGRRFLLLRSLQPRRSRGRLWPDGWRHTPPLCALAEAGVRRCRVDSQQRRDRSECCELRLSAQAVRYADARAFAKSSQRGALAEIRQIANVFGGGHTAGNAALGDLVVMSFDAGGTARSIDPSISVFEFLDRKILCPHFWLAGVWRI